jgi:hypothetical protein
MKYAYPQNPTGAITSVRRYDEGADSTTIQSSLERQQMIALVGETVPLLFCLRGDYGNNQGVQGGVWISPRLLQLGIQGSSLSMMYLLSQGKVDGLNIDNVYWGYQKLLDVDPNASFCWAYEQIPECLDLDYTPGGSLVWNTTKTSPGPSGTGSFTTEPNCTKISITWTSTIEVQGSAEIVSGFDKEMHLDIHWGCFPYVRDSSEWKPADIYDDNLEKFYDRGQETGKDCRNGKECQKDRICELFFDFGKRHLSASWDQKSEVRFDYAISRISDEVVVESGQIWVKHGTTSITFDGLAADQYRIQFSQKYKERNLKVQTYTISDPGDSLDSFYDQWYVNYPTSGPASGFTRQTNTGNETEIINSIITETIYNELEFPDVPGGDQQISGGVNDLTLMGINGDIGLLRPAGGVEYFLQSHVFVEQGIQVQHLLSNAVGPSRLYPELINHLMTSAQVLKQDQIDTDSLTVACRMNTRYSLFFNGLLQTTSNFAEWMIKTAPYFLLTPRQIDGRYGLAPVTPLNANYELSRDATIPDHVFDADEIVEGSYSRSYITPSDRQPICLVMVYRDQPEQSVGQTVTVEVRYPGTALSGPFEQHDLTEFCCTSAHATYAARYILAQRRFTTHTCSFSVNRAGRYVNPGQIIKVDLNVDTTDGQGIVDSTFYQVESVQEGQNGTINLELIHFPVDANGVSIIAKEVHEGVVSIQ